MSFRSHRSIPRGQAAVEALLALSLLGAFLHGVMLVGTQLMRGQQAAQISRVAAFRGVSGQTEHDGGAIAEVSFEFLPSSEKPGVLRFDRLSNISPEQRARRGHSIGNMHAAVLAKDWLGVDSRLRYAHATVGIDEARDDRRPALLSVRRHTTIALDGGEELSDTKVSQRIQHSATGWSKAARRSYDLGDKVIQRLQHVAVPGRNLTWSTNWVDAWRDLPAMQTDEVGADDLSEG